MAADPGYNQQLTFTELTEEEKAVLRECRRNSIVFRGLPLGTFSAYLMRHAIRSGYFPHVKKYSAIYYVGVFSLGFVSGIASYRDACTQKIMRLENSRLADQVRGFYQRAGMLHNGDLGGQSLFKQQNADYQGFHRSPDAISTEMPGQRRGGNREPTHFEDHSDTPNVSMIPSNDQRSNQEAPPPPSLYFELDKAKEDKVTSYSELRKKHRERWTPPNISSGPNRVQQARNRSEGEQDASEAPMSWFDRDSEHETSGEPGQKIHSPPNRTPYRQGPPIKKNKYGDVIE